MSQLDRIEKMLGSILASKNHIQWIGGYVWGETDNGDHFLILYSSSEFLKEKICRVYPHQFKKLPSFIPHEPPASLRDLVDNNPSRDKAIRRGIYNECRLFEVLLHDGKMTDLGPEQRFYDVLRVSSARPASSPPAAAVAYHDLLCYVSGDRVTVAAVPFFKAYKNKMDKEPFSYEHLKEWYRLNKNDISV